VNFKNPRLRKEFAIFETILLGVIIVLLSIGVWLLEIIKTKEIEKEEYRRTTVIYARLLDKHKERMKSIQEELE
jgi:hypothetical protein